MKQISASEQMLLIGDTKYLSSNQQMNVLKGTQRCDLHVIVCPYCNPVWVDELMADLREQPVNLYLPSCVEGNVGASRVHGFAMGEAEYVSFADPDDRVLPGAVAACIEALDADDGLGAVFTGEQVVNEGLEPIYGPDVAPYDRALHLANPRHVHGLIVMRRRLVEPLLEELALLRAIPEWYLTFAIAKTARLERVPMLGRLWRWHPTQATRQMRTQATLERKALAGLFAQG